ncbi:MULTISPECIES: DUF397 domain-containing protein [Actinomadura]|uniref:DUF397 domain-containing protein n=2 Tax=Actinomadura yumaensis TaxID=111807 RepID=A0ABW2CUZ2_9ACTN|nr:DUF397 domain-containing protein [Actinomadura sp. J1-007]MWK35069.1 DUF397 domain-containing protein [Actinomadura sp. J1-007]
MTEWRKSSRSATSDNTSCVEVAALARNIGVRDSKDPDGPRLALPTDTWRVLVERLKRDATA